MNETTISTIEKLIAVCKAAEAGFELAAKEVSASALQALFQGYSLQRSRHSRELEAAASALGRAALPKDGGAGAAVCRTGTVPGNGGTPRDEHAVLLECERGEDAAAAAYAAAMEDPELPPGVRELIAAHAIEIKGAHGELRKLLDRFAPVPKA